MLKQRKVRSNEIIIRYSTSRKITFFNYVTIDCFISHYIDFQDLCITIDGPAKDQACRFPFVWKGMKYYRCITDGIPNNGRPWCPTSEPFFSHSNDSNTWGICEDDCPRTEG